jgi:hypothetical protein
MRLAGYLLFVLAEILLACAAMIAAGRGQWTVTGFAAAFAVAAAGLSFLHLRRTR